MPIIPFQKLIDIQFSFINLGKRLLQELELEMNQTISNLMFWNLGSQ